MQNRLTDFLGLFKYLRFVPYDDPKVFDNETSQLWRENSVEDATETFKKLLSSIMIRRTKAILDLPARNDKVLWISFDVQEEERYRSVEQPVIESLEQSPGESWPNAIQQINKLRLICNLGLFAPQRSKQEQATALDGSLQSTLYARLSLGEGLCAQCLGPSLADDGLGATMSSNAYYSACSFIYCAACTQLLGFRSPSPCGCTSEPIPCPLLLLPSSIRTPQLTPTRDNTPGASPIGKDIRVSSKVRALIQQIKDFPAEKQ